MKIEQTENFRRALVALSIYDPKTYVLTTETLVQGKSAKVICRKYEISQSAYYERLKKGKAFLLTYLKHPFAETRAESVNKKFPKV